MEEDFDEFLRIPGIDKTEVNVHGVIDVALVAGEEFFAFRRMIEHFVQNIGSLFACEDGEEDAAAEHRVDESCRVAREHPAIAGKTRAAIRKISGAANWRHALGVAHRLHQERLFLDRLLKKIFRAQAGFLEDRAVEHDPHAGPGGR